MEEIIFQLECIKQKLLFMSQDHNILEFDINVLNGAISQLEDFSENILIFPHTIGKITFYRKDDLIEWIKIFQK